MQSWPLRSIAEQGIYRELIAGMLRIPAKNRTYRYWLPPSVTASIRKSEKRGFVSHHTDCICGSSDAQWHCENVNSVR